MRLTAFEREVLDGSHGDALAGVLREQVSVGEFFGADRLVEISNAHFMGDREVFGQAGLDYLTRLVDAGLTARVPTTRNAQSVDLEHAQLFAQSADLIEGEQRTRVLLRDLGVSAVNTCIGYQTVYQPRFGEHVAWGDTGTVAYANSVLGARTNYESGAAGLAAALTGRTPEYGYHLDTHRRANVRVRVSAALTDVAEWGALGTIVGERCRGYWNVPAIELAQARGPVSDQLKHFGASLASFGSMAMYHVVGITPEAPTFEAANRGREVLDEFEVTDADIEAALAREFPGGGEVDLVVFTAPQLSFFEAKQLADGLRGRKVADSVRLIATTNSMTFEALSEHGHLAAITDAGGVVLRGTCWYVMDPAAQRDTFGWRNLVTNSAKLVNIIRAHGYRPALRTTAECVEAAVTGRVSSR
ncbi:aconitase X [Prauserella cavernicola]|uniref:Aconitase X catalytic domain-containing protein n=1 Tax=Prauserella cavernicola TaxID=2800127 RepID=A0A934QMR7_9PSEU|nr:aconitase X catalytic domain-containing protein [Prauserella cavernicola]MBK1783426.1 aconitase X catalytic domain-containing protein [Prauserella cavernicola]